VPCLAAGRTLDHEHAVALDGEVGGQAGVGESALGDDLLDRLELHTEAALASAAAQQVVSHRVGERRAEALNPMVLELAMLSPTTDSSWLFDCRPVAPV
jgi:hypothetical protein